MHTPRVTLTAVGGKDTRDHKGHSLAYYTHIHCTYTHTYIHTYLPTLRTYMQEDSGRRLMSCTYIHMYTHGVRTFEGTSCNIQTNTYAAYCTIYTPNPTYCAHVCTDVRPAHRLCTMRHAVQKCTYCAPCVHQDSP